MDIRELSTVQAALSEAQRVSKALTISSQDKSFFRWAILKGPHPKTSSNEIFYILVDLRTQYTVCYIRDLNKLEQKCKKHNVDVNRIVLQFNT
jgi:hypothetical protein